MNNSIMDFALNDFSLNPDSYNKLKRIEIEEMTNSIIESDASNKQCLKMSRQILLDNKKKSVNFIIGDSPEFDFVIKNEQKKYTDKKYKQKNKLCDYDVPVLEYIDICMSNANNHKRKNKNKINYKNF
jgi:hypothetical protein